MSKCICCKREERELRMGYCWDCATAVSIIVDGTDMYEKGDAKTGMDKVKALLKKGWIPPASTTEQVNATK